MSVITPPVAVIVPATPVPFVPVLLKVIALPVVYPVPPLSII
jgi:hypothetical protein